MTTDNRPLTSNPEPADKPVRDDLIFNPPDLARTLARPIEQSPTGSATGPAGQDDDDE